MQSAARILTVFFSYYHHKNILPNIKLNQVVTIIVAIIFVAVKSLIKELRKTVIDSKKNAAALI
jgi:hypothetical protein